MKSPQEDSFGCLSIRFVKQTVDEDIEGTVGDGQPYENELEPVGDPCARLTMNEPH